MKSLFRSLLILTVLFLLNACERQSEPDAAAMAASSGAYKTCAACHGANGEGNRAMNAPALVNLEEWYLKRQLVNFQSGIRGKHPKDTWGMQMASQASLLKGDAGIDGVVAQIDGFDNITPAATIKGDSKRGKDFYNMTCGACHGPEGSGNLALNAPALRGLNDWYLVRQYENFRDGVRGSHADDTYGQQMLRMGQVLKTEQDIRDVAVWLGSLGIDD